MRFRRSIGIGRFARLNLSRTGVGFSLGRRGFRRSWHSSGRRTTTVGLPGTGMSWQEVDRTTNTDPPPSRFSVNDDFSPSIGRSRTSSRLPKGALAGALTVGAFGGAAGVGAAMSGSDRPTTGVVAVSTSSSIAPARGASTQVTLPIVTAPAVSAPVVTIPPTTTARTTTVPPPTVPPTAAPTPAPTEPPTVPQTDPPVAPSNCDPNYSGCVPIASDVDCAGGSGNGPAYVDGPVQVIGSDIYDLDRDGDGWGCDS